MYIYKTTCIISGKIYIGQCTITPELSRKYLGSGTLIKRAIAKYGIENFKKEILKSNIDTQKRLDIWEQIYIRKFNSIDPDIGYNILPGSSNGFACGSPMKIKAVADKASDSMNKYYSTIEGETMRKRISKSMKHKWKNGDFDETSRKTIFVKGEERLLGSNNPNYGNYWNEEKKSSLSIKMKGRYNGSDNPNFMNFWSEEKKLEASIRVKESGKSLGKLNGMFGKKRINNGITNMSIPKDNPIPEGWVLGMIRKCK